MQAFTYIVEPLKQPGTALPMDFLFEMIHLGYFETIFQFGFLFLTTRDTLNDIKLKYNRCGYIEMHP